MPDWWGQSGCFPRPRSGKLGREFRHGGYTAQGHLSRCRETPSTPNGPDDSGLRVFSSLCRAGIRGPGKYCGVVVFDRWGGCTQYSGVYVMYVSEKTKEGLRPYAGQSIQIDAKEVYQPKNPGDGRIGKFEYLGPAPETRSWVRLNDVRLRTAVQPGDDGKAVARITVENQGDKPVRLFGGELALTLLTKQEGRTRTVVPFRWPVLCTHDPAELAWDWSIRRSLGTGTHRNRPAVCLDHWKGGRLAWRFHARPPGEKSRRGEIRRSRRPI